MLTRWGENEGVLTHPDHCTDNGPGLLPDVRRDLPRLTRLRDRPQRFPGPAHPSPHARRLPCPKDAGEHASSCETKEGVNRRAAQCSPPEAREGTRWSTTGAAARAQREAAAFVTQAAPELVRRALRQHRDAPFARSHSLLPGAGRFPAAPVPRRWRDRARGARSTLIPDLGSEGGRENAVRRPLAGELSRRSRRCAAPWEQ